MVPGQFDLRSRFTLLPVILSASEESLFQRIDYGFGCSAKKDHIRSVAATLFPLKTALGHM
jgi:hypothetical protein